MIPESLYERALQSPAPASALRTVVADLGGRGHGKAVVYASLGQFLLRVRREGGPLAAQGGTILDVMGALTGFCHPEAELLHGQGPLAPPETQCPDPRSD